MSLRKKGAGRGVSLRRFSILMLFVSLVIMVILLVTTFRTVNAFHSLSAATSDYIEQAAAADNLMDASDYLTEEVQRYTVMGERTHLENYFREAEEDRRREQALAVMFKNAPNSPALTQLQAAMRESVDLMNREYYAMRLVLEASGDQDIPEAIRAVELTEEDRALSPEEKNAKARLLMHDSDYYAQKSRIRADMQECVDTLTENTHQVRQNMENRMGRCLTWMIILIVVQSVCVFKFLLLTNRLGVRPLLNAVNHIRRDEQLPVTGAQEFRYLADTYNKMYHTYKKNIESLSFKASHDGLTGVYNRAGYELIRESVDLATTARRRGPEEGGPGADGQLPLGGLYLPHRRGRVHGVHGQPEGQAGGTDPAEGGADQRSPGGHLGRIPGGEHERGYRRGRRGGGLPGAVPPRGHRPVLREGKRPQRLLLLRKGNEDQRPLTVSAVFDQ